MTRAVYTLRAGDAARHLIDVAIEAAVEGADHLDFRMPAWRPGRYAIQNFAGRVQEFQARDAASERILSWSRTDKDTWRVETGGCDGVEVRFRCYANVLDAGGSVLSADELYVNPISVAMAVDGRLNRPARLRLEIPESWRTVVPLDAAGPHEWHARDYHELVDSPFIASPTLVTLDFAVDGVPYHVHFQGCGCYDGARITSDLTRIVREQVAVMGGEHPARDYHFIYHLLPEKFSHGVEHARSASMALGPADDFDQEKFYDRFLGLSSHEFFHAWNVKRFRPDVLVPYDYWRERCTPLLYVAEGFTSYYGDRVLATSELWTRPRYFKALAEEIETLRSAPGQRVVSLEDASWDAWSAGYGAAPPTRSLSFYNKGELVGWLLDLEILRRSGGQRSLDHLMRLLDARFGEGRRGYSPADLEAAAAEAAGERLDDFFQACGRTADDLPLETAVAQLGLELHASHEKTKVEARLGCSVEDRGEGTVVTRVLPGRPACDAGLEAGDTLLAFDGRKATAETLGRMLGRLEVGEKVELAIMRRSVLKRLEATLGEACVESYELVPRASISPPQRRLLDAWLSPRTRPFTALKDGDPSPFRPQHRCGPAS